MSFTDSISNFPAKPFDKALSFFLSRSVRILDREHRVYFTRKQLYYEFCRSLIPGMEGFPSIVPFSLRPCIDYSRFCHLLSDYCESKRVPEKLVQADALSLNPLSGELADYAMPRLLICQNIDTAQMLIANNMHMELLCGIVDLESATPLPDLLCAMLGRASEPGIFFLHDASRAGYETASKLRRLTDAPVRASITGLGLRPRASLNLHLFCIRRMEDLSFRWQDPAYLSDRESARLRRGWLTEIESLSPLQLLTFLRNAVINGKPGCFSAVDLDGKFRGYSP